MMTPPESLASLVIPRGPRLGLADVAPPEQSGSRALIVVLAVLAVGGLVALVLLLRRRR
jgi:hypothetical protein